MGWYERLSGSDALEGARKASAIEEMEIRSWRKDNAPLSSDESLRWDGCLFTGYHLQKTEKDSSVEYLRTTLPGTWAKINTR